MAHPIETEGLPVKAAIEDLLVAWGVDVVVAGHVHACASVHLIPLFHSRS